jgi:hypothetical protein
MSQKTKQVLCIEDTIEYAYTSKGKIKTPENMKIQSGTIYTVVDEVVGHRGEMKYVLKEKPQNCRYKKRYFAEM